jgi:hypothetical protein
MAPPTQAKYTSRASYPQPVDYNPTSIAIAAAPAPACAGDCNDDGSVTIDEVIIGVNIALGATALTDCPSFDLNGGGEVTVDELVAAVGNALNGCPTS